MPGFFGFIGEDNLFDLNNLNLPSETYTPVVCDEKKGPNYYFKRYVIPKFLDDKVFGENITAIIGTDGILLNSQQLKKKYGLNTNFDLIEKIYSDHGVKGIYEIKGNYSGFIHHKKSQILHIFTDHIGSKPIFYYYDETRKFLIFGSELKNVVTIMRKLGCRPTLSETGAYCLLTFGFMIGDNSLVNEVKKLPPGTSLTYSDGQIEIVQHYKFSCLPEISDSEENIIKKLNSLFLEAIKLEYDKDLEYNYSHIATLSGGLDSRMNVMNAKKSGYIDILCLCFSQSNYFDEVIAKKIASNQEFDFIFHALDNGNYLKNIDEAVLVNDGLTLYAGSAHMLSSLKLLDWTECGLLHTGILSFSYYLSLNNHNSVNNYDIEHIAYSTKLMDQNRNNNLIIPKNYENAELFALYERVFNGIFNGYRIIEQFTEFSSPFQDKDFLEYAVRLPPKGRPNHKLYIKWILSEIPEAAKYPWEKTGVNVDAGTLRKFVRRNFQFLKAKYLGKNNINSMNPFEYWYYTNPGLKEFIETYYAKYIALLDNHTTLKDDAQRLFTEGTFLEKTQVLTLLAAIKLHSLEKQNP